VSGVEVASRRGGSLGLAPVAREGTAIVSCQRVRIYRWRAASAFYDFLQMYVNHVQMCVQTHRFAHGPFQLAVH